MTYDDPNCSLASGTGDHVCRGRDGAPLMPGADCFASASAQVYAPRANDLAPLATQDARTPASAPESNGASPSRTVVSEALRGRDTESGPVATTVPVSAELDGSRAVERVTSVATGRESEAAATGAPSRPKATPARPDVDDEVLAGEEAAWTAFAEGGAQ